MELVAESHQHFLTSLALNPISGDLYALCAANGAVLRCAMEKRDFTEVGCVEPAPAAFAFLHQDEGPQWVMTFPRGKMLLCATADVGCAADGADSQAEVPALELMPLLSPPHAVSLVAPTAVAVSPCDGEVYFTDGGWEGESSLLNPIGAVYRTVRNRSAVVAVQATGLAQPSGVAVGCDACVYVCEMCKNRLLRYVLCESGTRYFGGVFARFTGSMGPSAVVVHPTTGHVFVALYESPEVGRPYDLVEDESSPSSLTHSPSPLRGRVVELDLTGTEVRTFEVPSRELRALAFDAQGDYLYCLCSNSSGYWSALYRTAL